jgi:hypothetical protein
MKKLLIFTNIITLCALYFYSCTTSPNSVVAGEDKNLICDNYSSTTFEGLDSKLILEMAKNYKDNYYPSMHPTGNESLDARSIWFNLDTLKKFIWYIESKSIKNGLQNIPGLGIRLYYARYPKAEKYAEFPNLSNVNPTYQNMHTVFMLPTYKDAATGFNVEFDPNFIKNNVPESLKFRLQMAKKNPERNSFEVFCFRAISSDPNDPNLSQNHGNLIPPRFNSYEGAEVMEVVDQP